MRSRNLIRLGNKKSKIDQRNSFSNSVKLIRNNKKAINKQKKLPALRNKLQQNQNKNKILSKSKRRKCRRNRLLLQRLHHKIWSQPNRRNNMISKCMLQIELWRIRRNKMSTRSMMKRSHTTSWVSSSVDHLFSRDRCLRLNLKDLFHTMILLRDQLKQPKRRVRNLEKLPKMTVLLQIRINKLTLLSRKQLRNSFPKNNKRNKRKNKSNNKKIPRSSRLQQRLSRRISQMGRKMSRLCWISRSKLANKSRHSSKNSPRRASRPMPNSSSQPNSLFFLSPTKVKSQSCKAKRPLFKVNPRSTSYSKSLTARRSCLSMERSLSHLSIWQRIK